MLVPRRGAFAMLCDSIISQQLSIAAATTIFGRLVRLYPSRRLTPMAVFASTVPSLRAAGLSEQKVRYVQDLALAFQDGRVQPGRFSKQSNEEILQRSRVSRESDAGPSTVLNLFSESTRRTAGERSRHSPIHPTLISVACTSQPRTTTNDRGAM